MGAATDNKPVPSALCENAATVMLNEEKADSAIKRTDMARDSYGGSAPADQMLTVKQVAHLLHVHPNTVRLWSRAGDLKAYRIGRRRDYRFNLHDVKKFLYKDAGKPD
jgi:excisionase family DNA binding protein